MTNLEVDKEYWFKGKVIMIDKRDMAQPYKVQFGDCNSVWMPESFEVITEREEATIPNFVAEWIEETKRFYNLYGAMGRIRDNLAPSEIMKWFDTNPTLTGEILARAWLDGYEIDKEQLYWVRNKEGYSLLYNSDNGVEASHSYGVVVQKDNIKRFTFTEKEIKDYDERYFAFAVPVEEER